MRRPSRAARWRSTASGPRPRSRPLAAESRLSVAEIAWGIHSVVNENMAAAARVHVAERGRHASEFALLATGGGGPLHACEVAKRLGIRRVICPPGAGVASALGLLMAPARIDRVTTVAQAALRDRLGRAGEGVPRPRARRARGHRCDADRSREGDGRARGRPALRRPGIRARHAAAGRTVFREPRPHALRKAFLDEYRRIFGRVPPVGEIEIINIRVAVTRAGRARRAQGGGRRGHGGSDQGPAQGVAREPWRVCGNAGLRPLRAGRSARGVKGPAIIEEASTTAIVPPKAVATVDRSGNLNVVLGA